MRAYVNCVTAVCSTTIRELQRVARHKYIVHSLCARFLSVIIIIHALCVYIFGRYAQLVLHKGLSFIFLPFEGIINIFVPFHSYTIIVGITLLLRRFYTIFNEFRCMINTPRQDVVQCATL